MLDLHDRGSPALDLIDSLPGDDGLCSIGDVLPDVLRRYGVEAVAAQERSMVMFAKGDAVSALASLTC